MELLGEAHEAGEVGLARRLLLAEPAGNLDEKAPCACAIARTVSAAGASARAAQDTQHVPSRRPGEEGAAAPLVGDTGVREGFLELLRLRVDPVEDRRVLERDALADERRDPRDDGRDLTLDERLGPGERFLAGGPCRSQHLLGPGKHWHEAVREREDLRRRAVVALKPYHRRVRKPLWHREEVLGRRARERVDRLVVVADDAEVVAFAEPAFEQTSAGGG